MIFTSIEFLFFFATVLLIIGLLSVPATVKCFGAEKLAQIRRYVLLIASYFFYGWWDWRFCFLLFGLTLVAYFTALHIEAHRGKKWSVAIGVIVPLMILAIFKYFNFFIGSFTALFGHTTSDVLKIILPLGISFYTFQSISYTIDVYKGKLTASRDFFRFALYVAFFPQLISGPIVKASVLLPQIDEDRNITLQRLSEGAQIILLGFAKKMVLADNISVFVNEVYKAPQAFHSGTVALAVISYSLQLYFDFSGYSDMAIGCAKILGYDLPRNFNLPYLARNCSEFWKRWHISLSSWLMEYLYFPLGGNRKGKWRTYLNLMVTMALGGLWHGASWNFIIWGVIHGAMLSLHKFYLSMRGIDPKLRDPNPVTNLLKMIFTFCVVSIAWVFFRAETWSLATSIISRIFLWQDGVVHHFVWSYVGIAVLLIASAIALARSKQKNTPLFQADINGFYPLLNLNKFWSLVVFLFAVGLCVGLAYTASNPFIYFQF